MVIGIDRLHHSNCSRPPCLTGTAAFVPAVSSSPDVSAMSGVVSCVKTAVRGSCDASDVSDELAKLGRRSQNCKKKFNRIY